MKSPSSRRAWIEIHLIDGAIDEAKALGIETDTPEQLARYKEEWSR